MSPFFLCVCPPVLYFQISDPLSDLARPSSLLWMAIPSWMQRRAIPHSAQGGRLMRLCCHGRRPHNRKIRIDISIQFLPTPASRAFGAGLGPAPVWHTSSRRGLYVTAPGGFHTLRPRSPRGPVHAPQAQGASTFPPIACARDLSRAWPHYFQCSVHPTIPWRPSSLHAGLHHTASEPRPDPGKISHMHGPMSP